MPRFMDYLGPGPEPGRLDVIRPEPRNTEIYYVPSDEAVEYLSDASLPSRVKLIGIDRSKQRLTIHPINTRWKIETFLKPKYAKIRKLTLEGQHFVDLPYNPHGTTSDADGFPAEEDEVMMMLEDLPSSFIKDYEYGLGFSGDFKIIPPIVEKLTDASEILISDQQGSGIIADGDIFAISSDDFDQIRKLLQRIARNGQNAFRTVKYASVHNKLAEKLGIPEMEVAYGRSFLRRKFTQAAIDGEQVLSKSDQSALINAVSKHAKSIVEEQPGKLLRLQRDFELVKLDALIVRFEKMIDQSLQEGDWQEFLNENRFLLGIAFGYPVIFVGDEVSVGGHKLSGSGGKSSDFLVKNAMTNNIAIIEIKKPASQVLARSEYRKGVYAASNELSGAITQVIDQKHKLVSEFAQIKQNSRMFDIESYAISCCLIIGKTPESENERKSFEMIRGNSRDVDIVTFDEMLEKVKTIKECLQGDESAINEIANDGIAMPTETPW